MTGPDMQNECSTHLFSHATMLGNLMTHGNVAVAFQVQGCKVLEDHELINM